MATQANPINGSGIKIATRKGYAAGVALAPEVTEVLSRHAPELSGVPLYQVGGVGKVSIQVDVAGKSSSKKVSQVKRVLLTIKNELTKRGFDRLHVGITPIHPDLNRHQRQHSPRLNGKTVILSGPLMQSPPQAATAHLQ